jgi:hypothetical protein
MHVLSLFFPQLNLLWRWLIATAFGWATGLSLAAGVTTWLAQLGWVNEDRLMSYAMLLGAALLTSLAQGLALGGVLPSVGRWVSATLAGGLLAALWIWLLGALGVPGDSFLSNALLLVGIGLALGAGQWWLLRRRYPRAALWLPASALGYLVFLALVANPSQSLEELIVRVVVGGVFAAVLPGLLLVWWARAPTALQENTGGAHTAPDAHAAEGPPAGD